MKIIYIGSSGPLSLQPLQSLIQSQFAVSAIVIDATKEQLIPSVNKNTESLASLAFYNNIPLIKLTKNEKNNVSTIKQYHPDIILVSCYARKIPNTIIGLAKIGCFNIHPSLLPKYRGPTPLFWQFKNGEKKFGITLHRVTEEFDQGNIIAQQSTIMPEGASKEEASVLLAKLASEIILKQLPLFEKDNIHEIKQDETKSSYQSFPTKEDYRVSSRWTAKRVYNFIRANKRIGLSFSCKIAEQEYELIDAVLYQENAFADMKDDLYLINDGLISFKCQQGVIQCVLKNS